MNLEMEIENIEKLINNNKLNQQIIKDLHNVVYYYLLNGNHVNVDNSLYFVCYFIEKLLNNPKYQEYTINFIDKYEKYSKTVDNELNNILNYVHSKMTDYDNNFYPIFPLKSTKNMYIYHITHPLVLKFKNIYMNTSFNHSFIANCINIYLDHLTIKMNYLKNQIIKIELTNKFTKKKSKTTDIFDLLNQNYLLDYIPIKNEFNIMLKKHKSLVFDNSLDFILKSPSKYYSYNNEYNEYNEYNEFNYSNSDYFKKINNPSREFLYNLLYYYDELVFHHEYELPISVIQECHNNNDEKLWNIICTKKDTYGNKLKLMNYNK